MTNAVVFRPSQERYRELDFGTGFVFPQVIAERF